MNLYKFFILTTGIIFIAASVHAQNVDELKEKINERSQNIQQLEEEIRGYQTQIENISKEATSLKNTLASLDLSKKKIETNLTLTQRKIENTNQEIKELATQIDDKSERIGDSRRVIAHSLSAIAQSDNASLLETFLSSQSLASAWHSAEELTRLQATVGNRIHELKNIRISLVDNKKKTEEKKAELIVLERELADQKKVLAETVKEKNALLTSTKNTEAEYKRTLAQKQAQKEAFERELTEFESALKIAIDPTQFADAKKGFLIWPLDKVRITQYFGNTEFATANPQVYNGKGHTGIDVAASIGTKVKAARSGTVSGVGNTDLVRGCYSFGKWIMIEHPGGVSTLYAHLSLQNVAVGDKVTAGEVIGYSGNTGYSTGPHLHFGVYATQGVRIMKMQNSVNCRNAIIPVADPKAYLNPLSYL